MLIPRCLLVLRTRRLYFQPLIQRTLIQQVKHLLPSGENLDIEDSHIEAKVIQQSAAAAPVAADDNLKTILKKIRIQLFKLREVLNCKDKFENLFPRNSAASNFLLNTVQQTE